MGRAGPEGSELGTLEINNAKRYLVPSAGRIPRPPTTCTRACSLLIQQITLLGDYGVFYNARRAF